jgi:hypothetical protein
VGTWKYAPFLGPLREGKVSLVKQFFSEEIERYFKKKRPGKWADLSIGVRVWGMVGVSLLGLLREKENAYLCSFSWNQKTLKVKSEVHLELWQETRLT